MLEGVPVTDIKTEATWLGRRRVVDVETPYGNIKTKHVVNCTGVWANYIAAMVNFQKKTLVKWRRKSTKITEEHVILSKQTDVFLHH